MSQPKPPLRPPIAHSTSSSILSPFSSLQSPDSYFKELKSGPRRPRISGRSSESLTRLNTPTPKKRRQPNATSSSSPPVSIYSAGSLSQRSAAAIDAVGDDELSEYSPSTSQGFNNEVVTAPAVGDPPRPAKPGYEWVWYPDPYGYWAERPEIPRNAASTSKAWPKWTRISFTGKASSSIDRRESHAEQKDSNTKRRLSNAARRLSNTARRLSNAERRNSVKAVQQDANTSSGSNAAMEDCSPVSPTQESLGQKLIRGFQFLSPKISSPSGEGEGFFKSKVGRGKQVYHQNPSSSSSDQSILSRTGAILKGVSEFFEHHESQGSDKPQHYRKGFFTLHKRGSQDSAMSLTDSIRSILRGKTPVVTPVPGQKYTGSDGRRYMKVDLGTKNAPTYLPSEATRVHTPPLSDETPGMPARGFFFDLSPPCKDDDTTALSETSSPPKQALSPTQSRTVRFGSRSTTGWKSPESPATPGSRNRIAKLRTLWENGMQNEVKKEVKQPTFELDVPEHLPNSPLCPMNPKHKSGGTGICVYHGRRRRSSAVQ